MSEILNQDKTIEELIFKKYEFLKDHYEVQKNIGNGTFGEAILARDVKTGERKVLKAIVRPHKHNICNLIPEIINESNIKSLMQLLEDVKKEANAMKNLDHPNILKYYECFESEGHVCIVSEYCEGGNLLDVLREHSRNGTNVDFQDMKKWFHDLLNALNCLHDKNYIHRDIKPQNILFKNNVIKIADFGEAKHDLETWIPKDHTKLVGTLDYMSPEMLDRKSYNSKTDVWSMGCVFYNIYFLERPFTGDNEEKLKKCVLNSKLEKLDNKENDVTALIKRMLIKAADQRPFVNDLLDADLFKHNDFVKTNCLLNQTKMSNIKNKTENELNDEDTLKSCDNDDDLTKSKTVIPNKIQTENIQNNETILTEKVKNESNITCTQQQQADQSSLVSNLKKLSIENVWESISASISKKDGDDLIHLQINVPDCDKRNPVSIVCVIDLSGSMGSYAGNAPENKFYTRLDLVKHVLNVLIDCVDETDRLALITFSNETKVEFNLSLMNAENKVRAKDIIKQLKQGGNTYTIPALKMAYEEIKASPDNNINKIILLTDGKDSEEKSNFQSQFKQIKQTKNTQLHTFGFSNDIWSESLKEIAINGGGIFGFISDQTMIATVFLNCIASTFMTFAQNVSLKINTKKYELISPPNGLDRFTLFFGKKKNFLLKKIIDSTSSSSSSNYDFRLTRENGIIKYLLPKEEILDEKLFKIQLARKKLLDFCTDKHLTNIPLAKYSESNEILNVPEFFSEFKQIDNNQPDPNNQQLSLAIDYFFKWGQHYLNSMYFAHKNEQSLNYKSPSMQIYTNEKFNDLVETMTDKFRKMPLPEPTGDCARNTSNSEKVTTVTTEYLVDKNGGCILGTCKIKMENGEYKPIHSLKKNDVLFGGAKIVCLVKMEHLGSLAKIGRLYITPFHPVFFGDKWQFPYEIVTNKSAENIDLILGPLEDTCVFNIVLDKHHVVDVEGVGCITLGHMYDEGILKHDYFGTNKVIEDLSKLNGWNEGFISLKSYKIQRDSNGNVCGTSDHCYE